MTTITTLPTAPSRDDPSTFSSRADAFVAALPTFGTQANALASEVNAWASSASSSAAVAIASANFKGAWSSLTGALAVPASVLHSSQLWLLVSNVADVTAHTPGVSASWVNLETIQNDGLGYNQTWQDMTSSRSAGLTYTSPTDKPIQVSIVVRQTDNAKSIFADFKIIVSSVAYTIATANYAEFGTSGVSSVKLSTISAVVPRNTQYKLNFFDVDSGDIFTWYELR